MLRLLLEDYVKKYTAEDINLLEILKAYPKLRHDKGPWLAGGALLRLMTNEKLSEGDIDFYFPHSDKRRQFIERADLSIYMAKSNYNSWTFPTKPIKTSLIIKNYFKSIEDIFA